MIAFFFNPERREARALAERGAAWLANRDERSCLVVQSEEPPDLAEVTLLVSLGGDGTMLRAVDLATEQGVPVLGVNVGRLGYLTEVEPSGLESALEGFLEGRHRIEERMTLSVQGTRADGTDLPPQRALNEAVVEKTLPGHTVRVAAAIDGRPFVTFAADGLLVATPTGSTAYNLSARGPIVSPSLRAIVVTPVSPHMLFDRPLVLEPSESLELSILDPRPAALIVDGVTVGTLEPGSKVTCREGDRPARLVAVEGHDFHAVLRAKFHLADR